MLHHMLSFVGLQLVRDICQGHLDGGRVGSSEATLVPCSLTSGTFTADIQTAGLVLEPSAVILLEIHNMHGIFKVCTVVLVPLFVHSGQFWGKGKCGGGGEGGT